MPADPEQEVHSIFLAALEKPAAERPPFLDGACGANASLRRQIEHMLEAHAPKSGLDPLGEDETTRHAIPPPPKGGRPELPWAKAFGRPVGETPGVDTPNLPSQGARIGPYKLLQQIGEGGMGTVWMAEQTEPVKRIVALKVIKPGMDSSQVLARFEAERQAIALMDHPNIAKVLDAGTTSSGIRGHGSGVKQNKQTGQASTSEVDSSIPAGRPFFVMELVKGSPITKYCDEHQLTTRERLELFVPVCQAIQHAHQKGIIHRDIKPSNVLVASYDGKPVPKVIDFGVAKATGQKLTDRTMFTGFGGIVGTLEYMSPEQAEFNALDVDTRSDIYALGVLLYELLTGTTPLTSQRARAATLPEALRLIREEEPPKPSTRLSESLAGVPAVATRRRTEPAKLRKILRGELDWLVLKALEKDRDRRYETANGMAQDIQRYLRDEPVLARAPSAAYRLRKFAKRNKVPLVAAAVVLLALVGGIVGTTLAWLEAQRQRDAAELAQDNEATQRKEAEKQRDVALDAKNRARVNERKAQDEERKAKANEKKAQDEEANARASKDRALRKEAEMRAVLDFFQKKVLAAARPKGQENGLGIDTTIRAAVDAAEPKIAEAFRDKPLVEAAVRSTLGLTYSYLGEAKLAIRQHERALKLLEGQLGPDHPDTLATMSNLAVVQQSTGHLQEAVKLFQTALKLSQAKHGPANSQTLVLMNNLATAYKAAGQFNDAVVLLEKTVDLCKTHFGPEHPTTLQALNNLAQSYRSAGRLGEALPLLEQTLEQRRASKELGPEHPDTLISMNNLAAAYQDANRLDEAVALFEETLKLSRARFGPDHPQTLRTMNNLAWAYYAAGRRPLAVPLFEETLQRSTAKLGIEHPDTLISMNNLAFVYDDAGRRQEAVALYEKTLKLRKAVLGPDHPDTLVTMSNLAWMYKASDQLRDAEPLLRAAADGARRRMGLVHPTTRAYLNTLGDCYEDLHEPEKAEPLWRELAAFWKDQEGADSLAYAAQLAALGDNLLLQRKYADAEPLLRDCQAIRDLKQPDGWPRFSTLSLLGGSLLGQKKYEAAEPLLLQGYEGMKERARQIPPQRRILLTRALERIVQLYEALEQKEKADGWRKKLAENKKLPKG